MKVLRWVFLALYLALIAGLAALSFVTDKPVPVGAILIGVMLFSQALFILGAGTVRLCRPIRRRRLWMPVAVAALMLAVLMTGLSLALVELFEIEDVIQDSPTLWRVLGMDQYLGVSTQEFWFWSLLASSWLGWGILLWVYARRRRRMQVLSRLTGLVFAGSLLELVATVPSHIIVSRRPGCLVGICTMLGIIAGLCVMLFSFGPAVVLLFLRPRYRRERAETAANPSD